MSAPASVPPLLQSEAVFLVCPGDDAAPFWPAPCTDWGMPPPLGTARALAQIPGLRSTGEMGLDLPCPRAVTADEAELAARKGSFVEVDLDVRIVCLQGRDYGVFAGGFLMAPRSSISKTPLRLANAPAVIDGGYRGSIRSRFDVKEASDGASSGAQPNVIGPGHALLQALSPDGGCVRFAVVGPDAPPAVLALFAEGSTSRGTGAFGSTGASGKTSGDA